MEDGRWKMEDGRWKIFLPVYHAGRLCVNHVFHKLLLLEKPNTLYVMLCPYHSVVKRCPYQNITQDQSGGEGVDFQIVKPGKNRYHYIRGAYDFDYI
jgi:hypothetical protein